MFVFVTSLSVQYAEIIYSASGIEKNTTLLQRGAVYTGTMKQFVRSVFPHEFYGHPAYWRAFALAMVFLVLIIGQLFTFEKFDEVTAGYDLPGGFFTSITLAGLIPLLEVSALPYLLSMKLSAKWRNVSRFAAIAAPAVWTLIALWLNITGGGTTNEGGLFGATLPSAGGLWMLIFTGTLLWATLLVARELPMRK